MKLTVSPDSAQCIFLKLLLWMNQLSAGSIAVLWVLGLTGIEPTQAYPSDQQIPDWQEPSADWSQPPDAETTTLVHTAEEDRLGKESLRLSFANHPPISVAHNLPPSTSDPSVVAVAPTATEEEKPTTENEFNPDLDQQTPKSDRNCTDDTTCSQVSADRSKQSPTPANLTLAQLPSLPLPPLPVPSNPIPGSSNSSNSTVGQLPAFPSTSPSPAMVPMGVNGYNPSWGQSPAYPQTPTPAYIPATSLPVGASSYTNPSWGQSPAYPQTPTPVYIPANSLPVGANPYNPTWGQSPVYPQTPTPVYIPATSMPIGVSPYNLGGGQLPYAPQMVIVVPMPAGGVPMGTANYNPSMGQSPYAPQMVIVVPMPAGGVPMGATNYNPGMGQYPYIPQPPQAWPIPPTQNQAPFNSYNPGMGQFTYAPQTQAPLPPPVNPNASGYNSYNPVPGQSPYFPQTQAPLPPPVNPNTSGFNSYNPAMGQYSYAPQGQAPLPQPVNSNPGVPINYNPATGQYSYAPQGQAPLPQPVNSNLGQPNNYNAIIGQSPSFPQTPPALPNVPNPNLAPTPGLGQIQPNQDSSLLRSTALRDPSLQVQGTYVVQGDSSVARARLAGLYPLTPKLLFGATLDLTSDDSSLADSPNQGLNINELYLATAPFDDLPNLRFVVGQLDLTSYFDRNSFAKDGVTHFFNPAFQTNPALSATGISSRPGLLVNWTLTDNIEAKAAAFSSSASIGDFALDGFAGEVGVRYGNAIIRGTYSTARDAGSDTGFQEIFSIARGDGEVGLEPGDREEAYGLNAEYFIPEWNMGVFGRYGRYINRELDEAGDTYSFGVTFLDVFTQNDRLGLAYGQNLSNNQGREKPDVLELFYDFRFLPNLRLGFSLQQRDGFSETDVGVRVKTEFDVLPRE